MINSIMDGRRTTVCGDKLLVLTPVKDAVPHMARYVELLEAIHYPRALLSLGLLESDSEDGTFERLLALEPRLAARCRHVHISKRDFGFRIPARVPRWAPSYQLTRRSVLARSRNHLLFRALRDEDWVLWLDVDVIEYPPDVIQRLLATRKHIVTPHCVLEHGGKSFDGNAWRDRGRLHLDDLRSEGDLVRLDTVGATMLLVQADIHRDGLVFPAFDYGRQSPLIRGHTPEVETEGLGIMARDMGHQCWGLPNLEIRHAPE